MRTAFLFSVFVSLVFCAYSPEWDQYVSSYNKVYTNSAEEHKAFIAFQKNLQIIQQLNEEEALTGVEGHATFGVNKFTDLTPQEFRAHYLTYIRTDPEKLKNVPEESIYEKQDIDVPNAWDWRTKGSDSPIKNQMQCGDCWAFSATETIESAIFLQDKQSNLTAPPVLSVQQITSCDLLSFGCSGGNPMFAFSYVHSHGIEADKDYPFTSGNGTTGKCKYDASEVVAHIEGAKYASVPLFGSENTMRESSYQYGPLSVAVDASKWQYYTGGILTSCGLSLDHAVVAVGWDIDAGYWIVRNSWDSDWGEKGYIRLAYGNDTCGIKSEPTYVYGAHMG
eukprot:CAMPEP_0174257530 /NCGR_PEP_ID=MMETSP0439-20130205/6642_1 /TAXON_ID=0 /ORGANISM="Stereomyxa ramosa, Strain Chinc5" /LENGTH=335 /DNA_ID=CAMNT_0015340641 /DNA_START=40 /DNA_END=1047 /DNA_ORIENTATION=+